MSASTELCDRVSRIVNSVEYKDWEFEFFPAKSYIQIQFYAPDNNKGWGGSVLQRGRKWLISEHMTNSEIIQTCFLAIKVAEEHEMRENFRYAGQCIFGPRFDLDAVAEAVEGGTIPEDVRK